MILLCVSDIHGNLDALRAVLATAEKRSFHKLLVAGDMLFPGADSAETWRRLTLANAIMVSGATERALTTLTPSKLAPSTDDEKKMSERFEQIQRDLGDLVLHRLRKLPTHERIAMEDGRELLLVHGSPSDPFEAMTFDMDDEELNALIGDDPADVIVCGMSHVPFDREIGDLRIINVGSVGEAPDAREPGGPPVVAHATWIETSAGGITVEQVSIPLA